jgi:hypothetical protein
MANLSDQDKQELKRQALLKRSLELAQPEIEPDLGGMSDQEFAAYKRKLGLG